MVLDAQIDQPAHDHIGLPEGHPLFHQVIGTVGGVDKAARSRPLHVVPPDGQGVHHGGKDRQAHLHGVDGVKQGLLVLLHILVIGQRQPLHHGQQGDEVAVHPAGLAPDQLGHIGVLLLGHDGGAGGIGVVQIHKLELPGAPEDDLLREPGQVHHQNGQGGEQFNGVVPVGDRVHGVVGGLPEAQGLGRLEPVHRVGGGSQSSGSQGALVQPLQTVLQTGHIPLEHIGVGHHVVSKGGGLGPLEVGVARHHRVCMLPGLLRQHLLQVQDHRDDDGDLLLYIQAGVHRHLVVPGAGGVQALARVPDALGEQGLDVHVDVLVVHGELNLVRLNVRQDGLQALHDLLHLMLLNDSLLAQHLGMGDGSGDVLLVQPGVKLDGGVKIIDQCIGLLLKPASP